MRKLRYFLLALTLISPAHVWAQMNPEMLMIRQLSNGFPGAQKQKSLRLIPQMVFIHGDKLLMEDLVVGGGVKRIVRLDKRVVWELIDQGKKKIYAETPFSKFHQALKKSQAKMKRMKQQIQSSSLPAAQKRTIMLKNNFNPNGPPEFKLIDTKQKKTINKFPSRRYIIKRNRQVVVDVWTTEKIKTKPVFFKFYRALGVFHPEVVHRIKKISGFPIQMRVIIDLGLKGTFDLTSKVEMVKTTRSRPLSIFEIPKDYKKYKPKPPAKVCPVCSALVKDSQYKWPWKGRVYYFDQKSHRIKFMLWCAKNPNRRYPGGNSNSSSRNSNSSKGSSRSSRSSTDSDS